MVAGNTSMTNIYWQLLFIYITCAAIAMIEFFHRNRFFVSINKGNRIIKLRDEEILLNNFSEFQILSRPAWLTEDWDSYGLFVKTEGNKAKLIYGYSLWADIERLKNEIETRMNSH
jgi:hypothetical protein